jgi:hypothetical protein
MEKASESRRKLDPRPARDGSLAHPRDDLVRVLLKLTDEVERFDSMILLQRRIIEDRAAHPGELDDEEVNREAQAISTEAAELVVRARQALDELRRLGELTRSATPVAAHRDYSPAAARNRHAG